MERREKLPRMLPTTFPFERGETFGFEVFFPEGGIVTLEVSKIKISKGI